MNTAIRVGTVLVLLLQSLDHHLHVHTEFPGANDKTQQELDRALTHLGDEKPGLSSMLSLYVEVTSGLVDTTSASPSICVLTLTLFLKAPLLSARLLPLSQIKSTCGSYTLV